MRDYDFARGWRRESPKMKVNETLITVSTWDAQPTMERSSRSCRPSPNLVGNSKAKTRNLRVPFTRYTTRASLRKMQTQGAWIPRWHARRCRWLATPSVQMSSDLEIKSKNIQKQAHSKASTRCRCLWWRPRCWCCPFPGKVFVKKRPVQFVGRLDIFTVHNVTMSQCHTMLRSAKKCQEPFQTFWKPVGPSYTGHVSSSRLFFPRLCALANRIQLRWESSKVDSWAVDVDEDWDHVHLSQIPVVRKWGCFKVSVEVGIIMIFKIHWPCCFCQTETLSTFTTYPNKQTRMPPTAPRESILAQPASLDDLPDAKCFEKEHQTF